MLRGLNDEQVYLNWCFFVLSLNLLFAWTFRFHFRVSITITRRKGGISFKELGDVSIVRPFVGVGFFNRRQRLLWSGHCWHAWILEITQVRIKKFPRFLFLQRERLYGQVLNWGIRIALPIFVILRSFKAFRFVFGERTQPFAINLKRVDTLLSVILIEERKDKWYQPPYQR